MRATTVSKTRGGVQREGPRTHFMLAEILVLVGGVIPPAPSVPASARISARV